MSSLPSSQQSKSTSSLKSPTFGYSLNESSLDSAAPTTTYSQDSLDSSTIPQTLSVSEPTPAVSPEEYARFYKRQSRHEQERQSRRCRYGLPDDQLQPCNPIDTADADFHWETISLEGVDSNPETLEPQPITIPPPSGSSFPLAPTYIRNTIPDRRFRRGYYYTTDVLTSNETKEAEKDRMYSICAPPGTEPQAYDAENHEFVMGPIEGMIELPPGFPFTVALDGDARDTITVACLQTMESLEMYEEYEEITELVERVWEETWGTKTTVPLYRLGLIPNTRSSVLVPGRADGSYSLGVTVGEGQGIGVVQPVTQVNSPEAVIRMERLLSYLHTLWRLIVPLCVSKLEWVAWEGRAVDMNVFCPGGINPAFTGCQKNVSSARFGGTLKDFIGFIQGYWHLDHKDDQTGWTLLMVLLRIPPGSNAGDFLLGRPALYARSKPDSRGRVVFFLLFKGNDVHSGGAPCTNAEDWENFVEDLQTLYNYVVGEENRVVFVLYPSRAAFHREAGMAMTGRNGFGNEEGVSAKTKEKPHTFADDAFSLFCHDTHKVYMCRERFMMDFNQALDSGISLPSEMPFYLDLDNNVIPMPPLPHPINDAAWFDRMRALYCRIHHNNLRYFLSMSRSEFQNRQKKLETNLKKLHQGATTQSLDMPVAAFKMKTRSHGSLLKKPSGVGNVKESSDKNEWIVSGIVKSRPKGKKQVEYLVRWKGYPKFKDSWLSAKQIQDKELVLQWEKRQTDTGSTVTASQSTLPDNQVQKQIVIGSQTYQHISQLLDLDNLVAEYNDVQSAIVSSPSHSSLMSSTHSLLANSDALLGTYNHWDCHFGFDGDSGKTLLASLHLAVNTINQASLDSLKVDLLKRSLHLTICRALRFVFQWFSTWSNALLKNLFAEYSPAKTSEWYAAISVNYSLAIANLLKVIMVWVEAIAAHRNSKGRNRPALPAPLVLPADLFGLLLSPEDIQDITIPLPTSKSLRTQEDKIKYGGEVFVHIITDSIIVPGVRPFDEQLNSSGHSNNSPAMIIARTIVRGALVDALVDWLDSDCLLASLRIRKVLQSPTSLFRTPQGRTPDYMQLSKKILGLGEESAFDILGLVLSDNFDWADVGEAAGALSFAVQDGMAKLAKQDIKARGSTRGRKGKQMSFYKTLSSLPQVPEGTLLAELLPWPSGFRVDKLACILREALLSHRGEEANGHPLLRPLMKGRHPTLKRSLDPDHYNPIRATNQFQSLLTMSLQTSHELDEDWGLSNLLVRIGTGQGAKTEKFLKGYFTHWFESAEECVAAFELARTVSPNIVLDNMCCWGTPSAALGFTRPAPGSRPNFEARIEPMFTSDIVKLWRDFCDQDTLPSYNRALKLGEDTEIPGFGSGLTRMQLANSLAILGQCGLPSREDMADIIYIHNGMGAFEGLQRLGFNVWPGCEQSRVRQAFGCLYNFLDTNLSVTDKATLVFDPIFVEHLLCKISRWDKVFRKEDKDSLDTIAGEAHSLYEQGQLREDYPLPLSIDRETLASFVV